MPRADAEGTAERRLASAKRFNGLGDWPAAEKELRRGIQGLPDGGGELRARMLVTLALTELHLHGLDRALATLADARAQGAECGSAYAAALADIQEGTVWMSLGDWERGLTSLRAVRLGDLRVPLERLAVLLNRGLAEVTRLELGPGRRDLLAALALSEEQGWPEMVFKARHNLGCLEYFAGNLPAAIGLMRAADAMEVEVERVHARHDLARVLLEAGLVTQAVGLLEEAATTARARRQRIDEGEILLDLSRAHLLRGEAESASRAAGAAARAFASRDATGRAEAADLIRRTVDLNRGARTRAARPAYVDATTTSGRMGLRLVAESRLLARDLAGARGALAELGRRRRQDLSAELHERFLRAAVADAEGDGVGCGREVRAAATLLQQRQGAVPSLEVRAGLSIHGGRLADLDVERALRSGRPQDLYTSAERWRGSAQRTLPVMPDPDPEIAETVSQLRLLRLGGAREGDGTDDAARVAQLEERVRQLTWARSGSGTVGARPASYAEVRSRLVAADQTLLMYVAHREDRFALVVGEGVSAVRRLPAADVDALADRLRRDLRARSLARGTALVPMLDKAVAASALALDAAVVAPVADLLGDDVVIAPTRRLASCAWGLLPGLAPRALTVAGSVTRWARTDPRSVRPQVRVLTGPGVPGAAGEAQAVAARWHGAASAVEVTDGATSADLLAAFARAGVVHVAAHGTHEEQNPMFSSLRMSDGPAYVHELGSVAAGHAVLSACDVGQSAVSPGDEPLGLSAALLALGVGSVVASVSPLPDEVASEAMAAYHRMVAGGESAARALARTRAEVPGAQVLCLYGADWSAQ